MKGPVSVYLKIICSLQYILYNCHRQHYFPSNSKKVRRISGRNNFSYITWN